MLLKNHVFKRLLSVTVNQIKKGDYILHKLRIYSIQEISRHLHGRGGAIYKIDMKDCLTNAKLSERVISTHSFEYAERSVGSLVFAYADDKLHFFDSDYQEHVYEKQVLDGGPDNTVFLKENTSLVVEYYGGIESSSVKIRLPKEDVFEVREVGSQAVIPAGDKRTLGYVMGVLENGAELIVPDFVKVGDRVVVNIGTRQYVSRVK